MSAGLGSVPAEQTYLDITQGNRVFDSLYDSDLPPLKSKRECPGWWRSAVERAESAPADIVPGLLASTLEASGIGVRARTTGSGRAGAAGRGVRLRAGQGVGAQAACTLTSRGPRTATDAASEGLSEGPHSLPGGGLEIRNTSPGELPTLVRSLQGQDLLVALEEPPPDKGEALAIGVAGRGFEGDLTSGSTRLDGYVLATDLGPTILRRFGLAEPDAMSGQPIRAAGPVDAAAVASLGDRLSVISKRRGPVIGFSLLAWALALAAAAAGGRRAAESGTKVVGLSIVCLPLALLVAAALEPSQGAEQALAILAPPLLGFVLLGALGGYRALAAASAATVVAYAIDVLAGSPLTSLSLLGPNPGLGVRFYGIGNELEALLSVLVIGGTGAALSGFAPRLSARACATAFLAAGIFFAL
ncbi:MAG TPA: hypothetical protein VFL89_08050, partial [Solirubrobacterales bacterium]|nr:hypothetical protein [Solirubrobacterales bacterium]